jgi:uncharacterized membrane protein required for colicin V production|tara:strand:- start:605 stop:787 length:183 start_codon:yes stop_codon:yes gene_type:complete
MKATIKLKISDRELGIIIDALRGYNVLSTASKESMKLLSDMYSIERKLEKKLLEKNKGEK